MSDWAIWHRRSEYLRDIQQLHLFYTGGQSSSELPKLFMLANSVCIKESKATEMHDKDSKTLFSRASPLNGMCISFAMFIVR